MLAEGGAGHDAEAVLGDAGDREVALDAAARVEHLRVGDGADGPRDAVVAHPLQELGRPVAADLELGERGEVEERRGLAAGTVLLADGGRPQLARPAARPQRLVTERRVGLEPVGPLPAGLLAERGAQLLELRVGGGEPQRPSGLPLVARVLDVVVGRVDLCGPCQRVLPARVVAAEAARVHLPHVEARQPLHDPLGHQPPHAARTRQPVGAEAGGHPEAADLGGPEDELAVRCERLGAVDQPHDLGVQQ